MEDPSLMIVHSFNRHSLRAACARLGHRSDWDRVSEQGAQSFPGRHLSKNIIHGGKWLVRDDLKLEYLGPAGVAHRLCINL